MGKWFRGLMIFFALLLAAVGGFVGSIYMAAQQEPEFYKEVVVEQPPEKLEVAAEQLEEKVTELQEAVQDKGEWHTTFTQEQINGWLASELPREYPKALPSTVTDPRVIIDDGRAWLAWRYKDNSIDSVLAVQVEISLTGEANELMVRPVKARAGSVPIPVTHVTDRLTNLERSKVPARLAKLDGKPALYLKIPAEHPGYGERKVKIEELELRQGQISLTGSAEE